MIADTPLPPYYAVIFSSLRTEGDNGYNRMAEKMAELAMQQTGFLGMETAREQLGNHGFVLAQSRIDKAMERESGSQPGPGKRTYRMVPLI